MITDIAILCGGQATRLYPLTKTIPKSMIEFNGKPFLHYQLKLLEKQGIKNVVLCVGYKSAQIERFLAKNAHFYALNIMFSRDGDTPLGTGGAIKKAIPLLGEKFFVVYGDAYLPIDFSMVVKKYEESKKMSLMTVFRNDNEFDTSNIWYKGGKIIEYNKDCPHMYMKHIDYGLSIFSRYSFHRVLDGYYCDLADVHDTMLSMEELAAFEVYNRFYEVGSFSGIQQFKNYLEGN